MLQDTFIELVQQYTGNQQLAAVCWNELEKNYSDKGRHYHTLQHLDDLLRLMVPIKGFINDWNSLLFALFYHDIVYNPLKQDNEEKSALLAAARMQQMGVPAMIVTRSGGHILATKMHTANKDADTNYFTDADLAVLGQDWLTYADYFKNIRKEYSVYPSVIYNPGRRKVLKHFLGMERIFKTDYFHATFEAQAKYNLQQELELL